MLQTVIYGVLVVGGVCLLALAGFELVHRLVPAVSRQRHKARGRPAVIREQLLNAP
jgi:hypothetical protein